jgi:cytochrome c oxidase subunit 2
MAILDRFFAILDGGALLQQKRSHTFTMSGWRWPFALAMMAVLLAGCVEAPASRQMQSMLDAQGEGARIIEGQWSYLFWTGTAVYLLVVGLLAAILLRQLRMRRDAAPTLDESAGVRWIWWGGIALPLVLLPLTFAVVVSNGLALSAAPSQETVAIDVTGHQWWWHVAYEEEVFTLANHIYVPVGESVRIDLHSTNVIHSFWVPQLHFKVDLIPGKENSTWLRADKAGVYRGVCAEFCGKQHANMMFLVIALPREEFDAWLANERADARPPENELAQAGQEIFLSKNCLYCHMIRGTPAAGEQGPDLTHLANRLIIAGGALENTTGNLGGWIMDPQHIKPGSAMPQTPLTGGELQALLAYLRGLN